MEFVVLVDEKDHAVGVEEKMNAHRDGGKLHRAVSAFVFNSNGDMLLQKRDDSKYHAPGKWSNACCTHPREGESPDEAVHRRLREEMGFDCELKKVLEVVYKASVGGGLTEHEFDHVFTGTYDGEPKPARGEVAEVKWMGIPELKADVEANPAEYTPWFLILLPKLLKVMD
jgi:isopentenyl-diphosphate Delta-isomerase